MTIGILGGGQLGRMLALAAYPLGQRCTFVEPTLEAPVTGLGEHIRGAYDDPSALDALARVATVVTYEFESVPDSAVSFLSQRVPVYPPPRALSVAQDRWEEKTFFQSQGVPTADFARVDSRDDLAQAVARLGTPCVLKTRRFGYDGKGQFVIREPREADAAWADLGRVPLLLERFVPFRRELSLVCARAIHGSTVHYPLVENVHRQGILRVTRAPAPSPMPQTDEHRGGATHAGVFGLDDQARSFAERILNALDYVGVLAIEFFETDAGLVANEMAPRVHNSGHWTIEGAVTSQFENHIRAITGLPLGSASPRGASAMFNFIGKVPDVSQLLALDGAHVHLYGKEPAPGRKLGHVTLCAHDASTLATLEHQALSLIASD